MPELIEIVTKCHKIIDTYHSDEDIRTQKLPQEAMLLKVEQQKKERNATKISVSVWSSCGEEQNTQNTHY